MLLHAIFIWSAAGYVNLNGPEILRIIIPGATAVSLGVQVIFTSFFLSLLDMATEE